MKRARSSSIHRAVVEALEGRRLLSLAAPGVYGVGTNPQAIATADFNNDGRSDVVTANASGNNVSVLLSNANGTLQAAQNSATGAGPSGVAVGDLNNDGKRDVVTVNADNVSVLLGNGNGTFQAAQNLTLPLVFPPGYTGTTPIWQVPRSVAVGDLNADGKLDLVVGGQTTFFVPYMSPYGGTQYWPADHGHVNVLIGNGNGTFGTTNTSVQGISTSIEVRDFTGDGKLDVLTAGSGTAYLSSGNGNGTLQPAVASGGYASGRPAIGDFDGDAKLDLVFANGRSLYLLKGQGNGAFQFAKFTAQPADVRSVVAGDLNGDGKLDLVVNVNQTTFESYGYYGGYNPTTVEQTKVMLGAGDGTFARGVSANIRSFAGLGSSNASALGDFNADGRADLVATDPFNHKAFVQLNQPGWIIPGALAISDAAPVTEGNSGTVNAVFTVTLTEAPMATVSVNYGVIDFTATVGGGDFVATSGTLTFTPGQTSKTITVPVKGDRVGEYEEYFHVRLTDPINAEIIDGNATATIVDDEPSVSLAGQTVTEGNSGTVPLTFTATLSAASDAPVTVTYGTQNVTAVGMTDFVPITGTITFAPGQTTRTFAVQVRGDLVPEYEEYFHGLLTASTGALIVGEIQVPGIILDTDPDPSISIANVTRAEGGPGATTYFEFILSLSKPSEKDIWIQFSTASGTATSSGSSKDFYAEGSTVSIYAGQMFASIQIEVIGDNRSESDETFRVNLSLPNNVTIADNQAIGTILNDEIRGKTWIGAASGGSWSTAGNWSPSGVPVATSFVRITGAIVTVSSSVSVAELSLTDDAMLTVAPNGSRVVRTPALFVDYATLNLNDNDLIVDYTATGGSPLGAWNVWGYTGITGMVGFGSNHGAWNGGGIVTTRPDALSGRTTLGVAEASAVLGLTGSQTALFAGQTVDATTVLVKYTYGGDANLDGEVDIDDYGRIDTNASASGAAVGWYHGDFNYDGKINIDDYGMIDSNVGRQGAPLDSGGTGPAAPVAPAKSPAAPPAVATRRPPGSSTFAADDEDASDALALIAGTAADEILA